MKLLWTERSLNNLLAIREYISRDSATYAEAVVQRIMQRPDPQLLNHPRSGSIVPEIQRDDIRELFCHSFRIIYRILPHEVHVLTVIHGAKLFTLDA